MSVCVALCSFGPPRLPCRNRDTVETDVQQFGVVSAVLSFYLLENSFAVARSWQTAASDQDLVSDLCFDASHRVGVFSAIAAERLHGVGALMVLQSSFSLSLGVDVSMPLH